MALQRRDIWSQKPPDIRTSEQNNPTLLISWWATIFSFFIIVVRIIGRYIRVERFFLDDCVMMASLIPLFARMAFVHVVLLWGTNNTKTAGLTPLDISHREVGSKLVLAARIFYAIFIWTAKYAVCEFLARLSEMMWRRSMKIFLRFIRYFLASTLVAVVIATLAECQPFDHYWQVVPDPGVACRSGYANLITMGTCDVITDLVLVAFPIPIILMSNMGLKRKLFLVVLFAASLILVAITCYRVPTVIMRHGSQQYRSLVASLEILAATATSNAVVIGSFVRDRGVKKRKFKKDVASASVVESMDQSSFRRATITHHQWGSDSDLAADLGIRLEPELYSIDGDMPRPAMPAAPYHPVTTQTGSWDPNWDPNWPFKRYSIGSEDSKATTESADVKVSPLEYIETSKTPRKKSGDTASSTRRVSFVDPVGLVNSETGARRPSNTAQDSDSLASAPATRVRSGNSSRPGIMAGRTPANGRRGSAYSASSLDSAPSYRYPPDVSAPIIENEDVELQDAEGLLLSHEHD